MKTKHLILSLALILLAVVAPSLGVTIYQPATNHTIWEILYKMYTNDTLLNAYSVAAFPFTQEPTNTPTSGNAVLVTVTNGVTNLYYGTLSTSYGTTSATAYRGDWGLATSNTAFSAYLLSQDANTRSVAAGADATQALIRANAAGVLGTNNAEAIAGLGWDRVEPTILTAVDGTLTIPYTNSRTFAATLSGAATVTVDTASFTTNHIFSVRLDIDGSSLALTLPTSVVANAGYYSSTNVTINANGRTVLFLDKPWKGSFPCRIADF